MLHSQCRKAKQLQSSLLMLWDLTIPNKFASCEWKTQKGPGCHFYLLAPYFKQPFGAQQVGCHMFLSSFLPALPLFPT